MQSSSQRNRALAKWGSRVLPVLGLSIAIAPVAIADPPHLPSAWIDAYLCGSRALDAGDIETARRELELAATILPHNSATHYQLACARARDGRIDDAIAQLVLAMRDGFDDSALADWDADLAAVRADRRYASLRAKLVSGSKKASREPIASELAWRRYGTMLSANSEMNVIAVGRGGIGTLFDTRTGETLAILTRPGESTSAVAVSADGRFVAVAGDLAESVPSNRTNFLRVHDAATGDLLCDLEPAGWQASVDFDADCKHLLSTAVGSEGVIAYETQNWTRAKLETRTGSPAAFGKFADGVLSVFVGAPNDPRRVGEIAIGEENSWDWRVLGSDGHAVALRERSGAIALYDTRSGQLTSRASFSAHGWTNGLSVAEDESILVSSFDGTVTILSPSPTPEHWRRREFDGPALTAYAIGGSAIDSRTGATVANDPWIVAADGSLREFDLATGRTKQVFQPASSWIITSNLSRDGSLFAICDASGEVRFVSTTDGTIRATFSGLIDVSESFAPYPFIDFSPDGSRCVVASQTSIALIDVPRGKLIATLPGIAESPLAVWSQPLAWSRDGSRIAIASEGNRVRIFASEDGSDTGQAWTLDRPISALGFQPNGARLWVGTGKPSEPGREHERAQVVVIDPDSPSNAFERTIDFGALDEMGLIGVGSIALRDDIAIIGSRGYGIVAGFATDSGGLLWKHEYLAGNETPIHCTLDASGERIWTSGQGSWTPMVLDAKTGEILLDLSRRDVFGLALLPGSDRILASGERGVESYDARTGAFLWSRVETPNHGFVLRTESGHIEGTADAFRRIHLALPERSWPLDALAAGLLDVKKVAAAAAGIAVTPPRMPAMPTLTFSVPTARSAIWQPGDPAPRLRLEGQGADGLVGFEVRIADRIEFRAGEAIDASHRSLEIELPEPPESASIDVRVRSITTSGAMSRALYHESKRSTKP